MQNHQLLAAVLWTASLFTPAACFAAENALSIGTTAPDFRLPNVSGGGWSLDDARDAQLLVVAFIGVECPLVQLYAPRLEELASEYRDRGVQFVAIDSNQQDSPEEIVEFLRKHELTFPLLKDEHNRIADAFGATRTPEVFLLDAARVVVRYRGRIDDRGRVGIMRSKADRHDLKEAINELLTGKPVSQAELEAVGCLIGRRREATSSEVTYAKHVAPIFQARCVECHRAGEIGPFSMENHDDLVGWAEMIREVIEQDRMPPWGANPAHGSFSNDARLTADEKQTIFAWVEAGAPFGDRADLPPRRQFGADGWNIGEPDLVLPMAEKPFVVPAQGVLDYEHYLIDPGFTEDQWLTACEVRPGNRSVLHHVLVFSVPKEYKRGQIGSFFSGGLIGAYAPGTPPFTSPLGAARQLAAGSKILLQMHYTTNGKEQNDLSKVGFNFCDESEVKQELLARGAVNPLIQIPPHDPNYGSKSSYKFKRDSLLISVGPHMHVRGKDFRFEVQYPDGRHEILLDVPKYDFNWQLNYVFSEPKPMPKGTRLLCTAHFDNSAGNPANPDPSATVRFGEQTWDEMLIGWFTATTERDNSADE